MYVDIIILANLAVRPQHGYEIKKSVERVLGPEANLNNGMLYPALRRFEEMGAVEREVERHEGKPDRHIYRLSSLGREVLHDLLTEFPPEVARSETEFLVRVSFFDQLEPHERLAILDARAADLRRSLKRHDEILAMADTEHLPMPRFALETLAHDKEKTELELAWIARLAHEAADEAGTQEKGEPR
jgi:DNA-binding PadR family transcriptional regulator